MHTSAVAIGTGRLLKPATFQQMITKDLIGKTTAVKGFLTCFPQQPAYTYGLGIVSTGNWPTWPRRCLPYTVAGTASSSTDPVRVEPCSSRAWSSGRTGRTWYPPLSMSPCNDRCRSQPDRLDRVRV